ncbi:MAG TPA: cation:proton antiporter [Bacteroidota bacterium]|nr:cation:proton antiporter [Bacteroidota bacterium]
MHEFTILRDIVILLAAVTFIIPLFHRLRLPTIVGFILAGVIIGPHGTGLIREISDVQTLAEIGIALLLFSIGMELSFERIMKMWTSVLLGGGLQVLITAIATTGILYFFDFTFSEALFTGFLVSLSSTAIVMKILYDRGETHSPQGKIALGILLFQDLCFVPMLLLVPMLTTPGSINVPAFSIHIARGLLTVGGIILATRWLFPWLIERALKTGSRELFVLLVVVLSLGSAWVSSAAGLSLALGAFVAGLGLSQSEYHEQIVAETLPLRDILSSLFFVSLGMIVNFAHISDYPQAILGSLSVLIPMKILIAAAVVLFLRTQLRVALITGFLLGQVGEFSFILARAGEQSGMLGSTFYQGFYAVTLLSMLLAPFLIRLAPGVGAWVQRVVPGPAPREGEESRGREKELLRDHVIIVGYGLNGKNVATVLRETGIPFIVTELDVERYREAVSSGTKALYGDGTRDTILTEAGIGRARVLVVAISDPIATRMIIRTARRLNSGIFTLVRTRYVTEIGDLFAAGANEVIPEEFETSIEIFTRVLRRYHIPRNIITTQVDLLRREGYGMMRGQKIPEATMDQIQAILAAGTTDTFLIPPGSPCDGKSLTELNIRGKSGASILAVVRDGKPLLNPPPDTRLAAGDIVIVIGTHKEVDGAFDVLEGKQGGE